MFKKLIDFINNKKNEIGKLSFGSLCFATLKIALVWIIEYYNLFAPWLSYLIITTILIVFGWIYHSKITFNISLSFSTLIKFIQQSVGLQILENLTFNYIVYIIDINPKYAVIFNSCFIFLFRIFVYFNYVFKK